MFERFTDDARKVVVLAQEEARRLGHNYIGTEHILVGLLGVPSSKLHTFVTIEEVQEELEKLNPPSDKQASGHIPFTPRSKKVLELSLREALQLGHSFIDPNHLILGLIREGEGIGPQILVQLGYRLDELKKATVDHIKELYPGQEQPIIQAQAPKSSLPHHRCPHCGEVIQIEVLRG